MSELQEFVLGYVRAAGGIVEPPAYGVYEALLPEAVARRLGVDAFQRLAFADGAAQGDAKQLTYAHPLVEQMADAAWETPAVARFFINAVRLDKHGLAELAQQEFAFPNARLYPGPKASEEQALFHYLQVNFKAALVTDEKREQIVSVWMHAQGGYAVADLTGGAFLSLEVEPKREHLPTAPLLWLPDHAPTSREALTGLLERAGEAAVRGMAATVERLEGRAARYLELDRARLEQYFDDVESDLSRRLSRSGDADRRASLQGKLEATQADRAAKLADVEAKYRLRIELDPISMAVITQPKITLQVQIKNRHTAAARTVVWDPLRHLIEPLPCDVCRQSHTTLSLCHNGHLVCEAPACQAPQCVDCKRVFCKLCAHELTTCIVCARPLCQHSLNTCPECGRGTCRAHVSLCHAAAGEPEKLADVAPAKPQPPPSAAPPPATPARQKAAARKSRPKRRKPPARPAPARVRYSNLRMEVQVDSHKPEIVAFAFKSSGREMATRVWMLEEDGVAVRCLCEKGPACTANNKIFMPAPPYFIEEQLEEEIEKLREEYNISPRRVKYLLDTSRGDLKRLKKLTLRGPWKDSAKLQAVAQAFIEEYGPR